MVKKNSKISIKLFFILMIGFMIINYGHIMAIRLTFDNNLKKNFFLFLLYKANIYTPPRPIAKVKKAHLLPKLQKKNTKTRFTRKKLKVFRFQK